jgi:hypothetical protein
VTFREVASKKGLGRCVEPRGPPGHAARHIGDPGARDVTRRVRATSSRARVSPSLERLGPRNCPVHASGTRRVKAGACSARLAGLRRGNAVDGQRNWHRLVPASSGAKASLACEEERLERVCPRVEYGCRSRRTTPRSREARPAGKRATRTGIGAHGNLRKGGSGSCKGVDGRYRGGQAAAPIEARAGRLKGRRGAEVFERWKAPQVKFRVGSFTRAGS